MRFKTEEAKRTYEAAGMYSKSRLNDYQLGDGTWLSSVTVEGMQFQTRSFMTWGGIVSRANAGGAFQRRFPHYIGTTVCDEWRGDFQSFAAWYTSQVGYKEGWDVDKDAISNSKHYSPETCILLPRAVNLLFSKKWYGSVPLFAPLVDGTPRWRTTDRRIFTDKHEAYAHAMTLKSNYLAEIRDKYEPMGLPKQVLDKVAALVV